ncbi:MAG TPA: type II toxin-antitoxin system HicB family antitoxin, partial [Terriglobia bacterium]|nr:type II toxin-antitoxin system HicB family antitoxin [Terriglobia bacterium]
NREGVTGMELTAIFRKVPEGYIAWVEELSGANTQGASLAEARENLIEAVMMAFEANHKLSGTPVPEEFSLKDKISLAAG